MKTSKVLKIAKEYVSDGSRYHNALHCANDDKRITTGDMYRAEKIIGDLLGDMATLGTWLSTYRGIKWWDIHDGKKKLQETRHAWLDHLIKHYEAKGD